MNQNMMFKLKNLDWSFSKSNTSYLTHNLHPYPAKFIPQIPKTLINHLSNNGDTILDPFCGGGTTLVESNLLGRNAIGTDINPIAVLCSKVKSHKLSPKKMSSIKNHTKFLNMSNFNNLIYDERVVPLIPNIEHWFNKQVIHELAFIKSKINDIDDKDVQDFCKMIFSSIIVKFSNQKGETIYSSVKKESYKGDVIKNYIKKLNEFYDKMLNFNSVASNCFVKVFMDDARYLTKVLDKADLVITSPPYPNAFDYHLYHKHRIYWLDYDPVDVRNKEIGSHLNYQKKKENNIEEFKKDFSLCLNAINLKLKMNRYMCIVIGKSKFKGQIVDVPNIITDLAFNNGFEVKLNISRILPTFKRSFSNRARRANDESILIFRKTNDI